MIIRRAESALDLGSAHLLYLNINKYYLLQEHLKRNDCADAEEIVSPDGARHALIIVRVELSRHVDILVQAVMSSYAVGVGGVKAGVTWIVIQLFIA